VRNEQNNEVGKMKKLGNRQISCLESLVRFGVWPGGWFYDTRSGTERILRSLHARGLARLVLEPSGDLWVPGRRACFYPTKAGKELLEERKKVQKKG